MVLVGGWTKAFACACLAESQESDYNYDSRVTGKPDPSQASFPGQSQAACMARAPGMNLGATNSTRLTPLGHSVSSRGREGVSPFLVHSCKRGKRCWQLQTPFSALPIQHRAQCSPPPPPTISCPHNEESVLRCVWQHSKKNPKVEIPVPSLTCRGGLQEPDILENPERGNERKISILGALTTS